MTHHCHLFLRATDARERDVRGGRPTGRGRTSWKQLSGTMSQQVSCFQHCSSPTIDRVLRSLVTSSFLATHLAKEREVRKRLVLVGRSDSFLLVVASNPDHLFHSFPLSAVPTERSRRKESWTMDSSTHLESSLCCCTYRPWRIVSLSEVETILTF